MIKLNSCLFTVAAFLFIAQDGFSQAPTEADVQQIIDENLYVRGQSVELNGEGLKGLLDPFQTKMAVFGITFFDFKYESVTLVGRIVYVRLEANGKDVGIWPGPIKNGMRGRSLEVSIKADDALIVLGSGRGGNAMVKATPEEDGGEGGHGGLFRAWIEGDKNIVVAFTGDGGNGGDGGDGTAAKPHGKPGGQGGANWDLDIDVGTDTQVCLIGGLSGKGGGGGYPWIYFDEDLIVIGGGKGGDGEIACSAGNVLLGAESISDQTVAPSRIRTGSGGTGGSGRSGWKGGDGADGGDAGSIFLYDGARGIVDLGLGSFGGGGGFGIGFSGTKDGKPGSAGDPGEIKRIPKDK